MLTVVLIRLLKHDSIKYVNFIHFLFLNYLNYNELNMNVVASCEKGLKQQTNTEAH